MNRIERAKQTYEKLFKQVQSLSDSDDPEFMTILQRFIFGEVIYQGNLDDKMRELITLVVLSVNQTLPQLKAHVGAALNVGLTPVEIKEAVYQCAPYIGFPKTLNAISEVNEVFKRRNITLPIESQKTVEEENRLDKGLAMQVQILVMLFQKCGKMLRPIKSKYRITFPPFALAIFTPVMDSF